MGKSKEKPIFGCGIKLGIALWVVILVLMIVYGARHP